MRSLARNLSNKNKNQLLDTELDSLKTASKKAVHKTSEFLGKKIADVIAKLHEDSIVNAKPVIN